MPALVLAGLLATACGDEPEPTGFSMTLATLGPDEACAAATDGDDPEELCFPAGLLDLPDGVEVQPDDCVRVELVEPGGDVDRAIWDGRCAAGPVELGLEVDGDEVTVLIPECLGSLTSFTVLDASGARVWSVARQGSPEHPLIQRITLGEAPPGFAVNDPYQPPASGTEVTASARQQLDLPPGSTTFTAGEVGARDPSGCRTAWEDAGA